MQPGTSVPAGLILLACAVANAETKLEPPIIIARNAIQPQVAAGGSGRIAITFIQAGNIAVSVSEDDGKTFGPPVIAIDVKGQAHGGAQRGPRIGLDGKGVLFVTAPVTFDEAEQKRKYPTAELYLVSSSDGGKTWTKPLQVNSAPKKAPESLHWLAVSPDGAAHVTWLDLRGRLTAGQDIYYAKVTGSSISANRKVAEDVCECCAPGLALRASSPILAWREGGKEKPSREIFALEITEKAEAEQKAVRINSRDSKVPG